MKPFLKTKRMQKLIEEATQIAMNQSYHYGITKLLAKNAGENNGAAKLSTFEVKAIRAIYGLSQEQLAIKFGVKRSTIQNILNGKTWRHLI